MKFSGHFSGPAVIIHGGVNLRRVEGDEAKQNASVISDILKESWAMLGAGKRAVDVVCRAVEMLENEPCFNAGRGAAIQSDGSVKLSASLMDGTRERFSGVNLASHLINPSKLARLLQEKEDRVLGPLGAQLVARELGIPPENPITAKQARKWLKEIEKREAVEKTGTVGAVVCDAQGRLAAATSTGGRSFEYPDRMSDVGSVAGNYASEYSAISCTGIGEQIIDAALAPRIDTRVRDGKTIIDASNITFDEADKKKQLYGWIGIDHDSNWVIYYTTETIAAGIISASHERPFIATD